MAALVAQQMRDKDGRGLGKSHLEETSSDREARALVRMEDLGNHIEHRGALEENTCEGPGSCGLFRRNK